MNEASALLFPLAWKSKIPTENSTLLYLMVTWNFSVTQELHLKSVIKGIIFKGKDLGLRKKEATYSCGVEEEEGGHVKSYKWSARRTHRPLPTTLSKNRKW